MLTESNNQYLFPNQVNANTLDYKRPIFIFIPRLSDSTITFRPNYKRPIFTLEPSKYFQTQVQTANIYFRTK